MRSHDNLLANSEATLYLVTQLAPSEKKDRVLDVPDAIFTNKYYLPLLEMVVNSSEAFAEKI